MNRFDVEASTNILDTNVFYESDKFRVTNKE